MPEILEVVQPGVYPWWILWFALIPVVFGITFAILDEEGSWFGLGAVAGVVALFIMGAVGATVQGDHNESVHVSALAEAGFQEVEYDGYEQFDAVWNGERVRGMLVLNDKVGDKITYQIIIIPPVTK